MDALHVVSASVRKYFQKIHGNLKLQRLKTQRFRRNYYFDETQIHLNANSSSFEKFYKFDTFLFPYSIIQPTDRIAVLSDFDGTLAEIHPDPSKTTIKPESKLAFEQLTKRPNVFTAVISGRPMYDVRARVAIDNVTYSGNHGMEILFTNNTEYHHPISPEMYDNCLRLKAILNEKVCF